MAKFIKKIGDTEVTVGAVLPSDGSSTNNKTGSWRAHRPVTDQEKCTACGICWSLCPDACIKKGENGKFSADLDFCKGCGICATECPVKAITMEKEEK
ncbi:MAG: 4Fe-4S binding protein [Candidatus Altiarchaeota archaeon]